MDGAMTMPARLRCGKCRVKVTSCPRSRSTRAMVCAGWVAYERFVVELVAHQNADALPGLGRGPGQCGGRARPRHVQASGLAVTSCGTRHEGRWFGGVPPGYATACRDGRRFIC